MKVVLNKIIVLGCVFFICVFTASAQIATTNNTAAQIPYLRNLKTHSQIIVDGKPFLMVAGELHNSTCSAPEYFSQAMQNAKAMHANTVIASVAWEQFEPQEGKFDYSLIDFILKNAIEKKLKVVLIWFATWKNGESSYVPIWVKKDGNRFFRIINKAGEKMTAISPFCEAAMKADATAFANLIKYIKLKDVHHSIIMMQPENEVGAFSEMDYNAVAVKKYTEQVPQQLVNYLVAHQQQLEKELKTAWQVNGAKQQGTWGELFGEKNYDAQNFFMSWQYATFMNEVCKKGKKILPLPMYVNAWLVQFPGEMPGKYPNGGPVSRVMDIYKAAAPAIDFIAPDIYLPNFKEVCSMYSRPSKSNPLFIPECERSNPGKAYYSFAANNAMGFGPFGIESLISDDAYAMSFKLLKEELLPVVATYQGTGKMNGVLREGNEDTVSIIVGPYRCFIEFMERGKNGYGIIIQTGEDEMLVAGINLKISFFSTLIKQKINIGQVQEGGYNNQQWNTYRYLNGDETWHNSFLFAKGRSYAVGFENKKKKLQQVMAPIAVLNQNLETNLQQQQVECPGIYKVKVYGVN
jgi:beta-galactosidase GanA